MPSLGVKFFEPSEDEFKNMAALIRKIEMDPECLKTGMAKVSIKMY